MNKTQDYIKNVRNFDYAQIGIFVVGVLSILPLAFKVYILDILWINTLFIFHLTMTVASIGYLINIIKIFIQGNHKRTSLIIAIVLFLLNLGIAITNCYFIWTYYFQ